jgi:predicted metal-dependent hydrolase
MNHGSQFWSLVAEQVPDYKACVANLRIVEKELMQLK